MYFLADGSAPIPQGHNHQVPVGSFQFLSPGFEVIIAVRRAVRRGIVTTFVVAILVFVVF